jgi:hypothetical protein
MTVAKSRHSAKSAPQTECFWGRAYYARDTGLKFSADEIAREVMKGHGTVAERVEAFEKQIMPLLKRVAETRMANDTGERGVVPFSRP